MDAPLHKSVPLIELPSFIKSIATHLYFRQSLINDYLLCPQMSLYRWILKTTDAPTFFSAVLGTAGHAVISEIHETSTWQLATDTLTKLFVHYAKAELTKLERLPAISVRFKSHEDQIIRLAPEYVHFLSEYCKDKRNQSFHPVINEASFALELPGNNTGEVHRGDTPTEYYEKVEQPYLFTGMIDQGGYYDSGDFAIRDIKFRESAFKPDGFKLNFNKQLTLYTAGVRYGVPACEACKPIYANEQGEFGSYLLDGYEFENSDLGVNPNGPPTASPIVYKGPCDACRAKVGTNKWPQILPTRSELIWMRDYKTYEKDQYKKYNKSLNEKTINPKTGRKVRADVINHKYLTGFKKGEHRGPAILSTRRTQEQLSTYMAEMRVICNSIRQGIFYRREGDHCTNWCRHRDSCLNRVELQMGATLNQVVAGTALEDNFTKDFFAS